MKIYFCRHSKTIWNQEHRLQGWQDSPLTTQGVEDAYLLKERMKEIQIDYCYSSPIGRAKQTTNILFEDDIIYYDHRLKEMNFGDFEGRYVKDLLKEETYWCLWNQPTYDLSLPNGETFQEVKDRLSIFLDDIYKKHSDKTIFITGHGMMMIVLRSMIESCPIENLPEINEVFRGCSLSEVDYDGHTFCIHYLNDSKHLSPDYQQKNYGK